MWAEIRAKLEGDFQTAWATIGGGFKVAYKNVAFKQPTGAGAEFARFAIIGAESDLRGIGTRKPERQFGLVMIQIFTPKDTGSKRSAELADLMAPIFRYQALRAANGVRITFHQAPRLQDTGERTDFFQQNLAMPFVADKVFTVTG